MSLSVKCIKSAVAGGMALLVVGCAGYPFGFLYNGTEVPHGMERNESSGPGKTGEKSGESCVTGILGIVAFGDASLNSAKKAGGITDLHSVEFHDTNILGIYTQGCTEAHGK